MKERSENRGVLSDPGVHLHGHMKEGLKRGMVSHLGCHCCSSRCSSSNSSMMMVLGELLVSLSAAAHKSKKCHQ